MCKKNVYEAYVSAYEGMVESWYPAVPIGVIGLVPQAQVKWIIDLPRGCPSLPAPTFP